jgi:nitronate monooxygenase
LKLGKLEIDLPIIQAPMAGVSTPALAAAVCNAGALGSIGIGASDPYAAQGMINELFALTDRPFNVNVFCHQPAKIKLELENRWIERLLPHFAQMGAEPPRFLREIYATFVGDYEMTELLVQLKPALVSFHFGLPREAQIESLRAAGITLMASATNLDEARQIERAGLDAVVAQGFEAGGHRGIFHPDSGDECLGTLELTKALTNNLRLPVIAAGGIIDGASIAAALKLGAVAGMLGTAFIGCSESAADEGYRAALRSDAANHTVMTSAISGRPARCLSNRFTALGASVAESQIPDYPRTYDAGKALNAAAKKKGEYGYGAQWAGEGAPLSRFMGAAELVAVLSSELRSSLS